MRSRPARRCERALLLKETGGPPLAFRIAMGVRPADQNWKRELNKLIADNQADINRILLGFGVPLLDEKDRPITMERDDSAMRHARGARPLGLPRRIRRGRCPRRKPAARARRAIAPRTIARRRRRRLPAPACSRPPRPKRLWRRSRRRLHRRAAPCPATRQPAAGNDLARQAAAQHSRQHLASRYRLRRARQRDGRLSAHAISSAPPAATARSSSSSIACAIAGCRGTRRSASCRWDTSTSPGIPTGPTAGLACSSRSPRRSRRRRSRTELSSRGGVTAPWSARSCG